MLRFPRLPKSTNTAFISGVDTISAGENPVLFQMSGRGCDFSVKSISTFESDEIAWDDNKGKTGKSTKISGGNLTGVVEL